MLAFLVNNFTFAHRAKWSPFFEGSISGTYKTILKITGTDNLGAGRNSDTVVTNIPTGKIYWEKLQRCFKVLSEVDLQIFRDIFSNIETAWKKGRMFLSEIKWAGWHETLSRNEPLEGKWMIQLFVFSLSTSFHRLYKLKGGKRKRGCQKIVIIYFDWLPQLTTTLLSKASASSQSPKARGQTFHNPIKWLPRANEMDLKCAMPATSRHSCPHYLKWHCIHSKWEQWRDKTTLKPFAGLKKETTRHNLS